MVDKSWIEDPLKFQRLCWPDVKFYDKQIEIIESVAYNDETIVPAGNKLGKDFVAAFIALWFFCSRSPARVVTSSAGQNQLKSVLWGEIRRFINTSKYPLPIQVNDLLLRQVKPDGSIEARSYLQGIVTNVEENLLGHHLEYNGKARTLIIFDEASSIDDMFWDASDTWAHRKLLIGNPLPCSNRFFHGTKKGNVSRPNGKGYYTKIIKIKASDSPNVRLAEAEIALGKEPSGRELVPGVIDYALYRKRRDTWDAIRQSMGLDAEFYTGAEVLLYPPGWLDAAERLAAKQVMTRTTERSMGVDPGEGSAETCWVIIDRAGIIHLRAERTPDTSKIPAITIALMMQYGVPAANVCFDRGGGGKQHADALRAKGCLVRTVGFGEPSTDPKLLKRMITSKDKQKASEQRYAYKNRRSEMYFMLRLLLTPEENSNTEEVKVKFGIPEKYIELRRQLAPVPLLYNEEGRIYLYPKDKPSPEYKGKTMIDLVGCSPDQSDALVLAVYGLNTISHPMKAGAL